jgi:chitinase
MRRWKMCFGLIFTLIGFIVTLMLHPGKVNAVDMNQRYWVGGYYVGYLRDRYPIEQIEWSGLTHLFIGNIIPNADGTLNTELNIGAEGPQLMTDLVQASHQQGKKAIAFVGGDGYRQGWVEAASDANRAAFVDNLVQLKQSYGFDGLDLDWEPVEDVDQSDVLQLVKALRAAMPDALLTFPAGGVINDNFPPDLSFYGQLAPYLDQINLMTYGIAGKYDGWKSWHSSPLYYRNPATPSAIDSTVKKYLEVGQIPAEKLGIGIGVFGTCWGAPVTAPEQDIAESSVLATDSEMSFSTVMTEYFSEANRQWDETARVPYLSFAAPTGAKQCTFISYDDQESIAEKAKYVKEKGLGGAILWNINQGYIGGNPEGQRNPLLSATRAEFLEGQ